MTLVQDRPPSELAALRVAAASVRQARADVGTREPWAFEAAGLHLGVAEAALPEPDEARHKRAAVLSRDVAAGQVEVARGRAEDSARNVRDLLVAAGRERAESDKALAAERLAREQDRIDARHGTLMRLAGCFVVGAALCAVWSRYGTACVLGVCAGACLVAARLAGNVWLGHVEAVVAVVFLLAVGWHGVCRIRAWRQNRKLVLES